MAAAHGETQNVEVPGSLRREQPWLYPYNRRLRHLQGISIRNLTLNTRTTRSRGASVDDEVLPYSLKSPAKALAVREHKQLEHSRSQTNLRAIKEAEEGVVSKGKENAIASDGEEIPKTPKRPGIGKLRRRSTLEWLTASPSVRQKKLADIVSTRMADVFFSLHVEGLDEPIYISESLEKVMNPDFRFFNLSEMGPSISRLDELTIKVWAKNESMEDFRYHIEMSLHLRSLQFIGKTMASWKTPLPANCILFHMTDGIYTSFTDMPAIEPPITALSTPQRALSNQILPTSSYDALMKLSTLDDCIQDALHTRATLEDDIAAILTNHKKALAEVHSVSEDEQLLSGIQEAIAAEKKSLAVARKRRDELKAQIDFRKEYMLKGRESMRSGEEEIKSLQEPLNERKDSLKQVSEEIAGQRRRVCEDLCRIYPIEPIPIRALSFTIRGLELPNTDFDDCDEEAVAAALGHAAQVVHLLQFYLAIPLPYPIQPRGSTSLIEDPISNTVGSRTYPLFMKGAIKYRFEFGVFLLNKNIDVLAMDMGLKLGDIRLTLPNLKYLLYIATAGKGEIPARKAGGIRGFLRGGGALDGSGMSSRRGSDDSLGSSILTLTDGKQAAGAIQKKILANGTLNKSNGNAIKGGYGGLGLGHHGVRTGSKLRDVS